jgi:heptosyltransferase-3
MRVRQAGDDFASILVVCTRQIGDVLLTTPLIRAAKARWPAASIDVLGFAGTLGMLRGNPDVHATIEVGPGSGWRESWPLVRRLWRRYDLALVAQHSDRAHLYAFVASPLRAGLVPRRGGRWKRRLLAHAVEVGGDRGEVHAVTEKVRLLDPWREAPVRTEVVPPPPAPLPGDLESVLRPGHVVVHAPSMWRYKQWPVDHFRTVIAALLADGRQVVLTGGSAAADRAVTARLSALAAPPALLDAAGRLDLNQTTRLLQGAALYIGPDTSITHLAAACGVSVVAAFGPTNPQRWGPWPARAPSEQPYVRRAQRQRVGRVIVLQGPDLPSGPCVPCGRAGCEDHNASRSHCLEHIEPERVIAEARALLANASD